MPLFLLLETSGRQAAKKLRRAAGLGPSLAGLFLEPFASDAHALLLVRIWWTKRAHIGGDLPYFAFVRAADDDVRLLVHRDLDSFRNREFDGMRLAESERHDFALEFGAVADAHDVQIFFE